MTSELNSQAVSRRTSVSTSAISCSEALRAIGQDLEARGIKTFVIRPEADFYVVRLVTNRLQPPPPSAYITHWMILNDWITKDEREEIMMRVLKTFLDYPKSYGRSVATSVVKRLACSVLRTMP